MDTQNTIILRNLSKSSGPVFTVPTFLTISRYGFYLGSVKNNSLSFLTEFLKSELKCLSVDELLYVFSSLNLVQLPDPVKNVTE